MVDKLSSLSLLKVHFPENIGLFTVYNVTSTLDSMVCYYYFTLYCSKL